MDFEQYNDGVKDWATRMKQNMKATGQGMGIQHRPGSLSPGPSLDKIKTGFKTIDGAIEVITFRFPRSLIYPHKGAGKGMAGHSGSTWVDRFGETKKTNPASLGKQGTSGRRAKPWFTRTLDAPGGTDQLADMVAENLGATISNNILKEN